VIFDHGHVCVVELEGTINGGSSSYCHSSRAIMYKDKRLQEYRLDISSEDIVDGLIRTMSLERNVM